MAELRANTDVMRKEANNLQSSANAMYQVAAIVGGLDNKVDRGKYEGQLASKVENILGGSGAQATQLDGRLQALRNELNSRASAIDNVMQSRFENLLQIDQAITNLSSRSPLINILFRAKELRLDYLRDLLTLTGVNPVNAALLITIFPWLRERIITQSVSQSSVQNGTRQISQQGSGSKNPELERTFVSPTSRVITDQNNLYFPFGAKYTFGDRKGDRHPGIDIKGDLGEIVHPIGNGKIVDIRSDSKGYGNYIIVEHQTESGVKIFSVYAHLDNDSLNNLHIDEPVDKSTEIGKIGESGNWGGYHHLHLEVRTETGYQPWKYYSDALKDDWKDHWLDPITVVENPIYKIKPL